MPVAFKHHDILRLFVEIAQHRSFSEAAEALHLTKGAVSYQIKTLEAFLGFSLFRRNARGVSLTADGQHLLNVCHGHYRDIEAELLALKGIATKSLTVGMSSYFAARWLSPRLMSFMQEHPDIQLRIQPMIQLFDLAHQGVDLAIRWGNGNWNDADVSPFMPLPAFPVGNAAAVRKLEDVGMAEAFSSFTLLRDHDNSNAWSDWLTGAGLPHQSRRDALIMPDPNVRVQAVIDGQGVALMDPMIEKELSDGQLFRLSELELGSYGYFLVRPRAGEAPASVDVFADWLGTV